MLTHTVPLDEPIRLTVAAAKSGDGGLALTVLDRGIARTSVFLSNPDQAHHLLAALVDASRHMDWLSESQATAILHTMRCRRPWWRRWLARRI